MFAFLFVHTVYTLAKRSLYRHAPHGGACGVVRNVKHLAQLSEHLCLKLSASDRVFYRYGMFIGIKSVKAEYNKLLRFSHPALGLSFYNPVQSLTVVLSQPQIVTRVWLDQNIFSDATGRNSFELVCLHVMASC